MYLITAYFDEKTNKILQRYIEKIASVSGNNFMTGHNVPPHMTISAIEARSSDVLLPAFQSLNLSTGSLRFVSIGQMLPYVFYVTPVLNEYLMDIQKEVFQSFKNISETSISRYYQPYSWLPHVTLGKTLTKEQMRKAFGAMQDSFIPFDATITEIGLAKVNPHEDVTRRLLY